MGKTKSYNYNDAIRNNRFKDIERLYAKGHKFHKHNLLTTLKCNNIKMFKWFLEKGAPLQRNTFNELLYLKEWNIAKNILLGKLKYNYDNEGYESSFWNEINTIEEKNIYNHPLISRTIYIRTYEENDFDWYLDTMEIAARLNNLDFILFLKENKLSDWTFNLINIASYYNNFELVRKLIDLGCPIEQCFFISDIYKYYRSLTSDYRSLELKEFPMRAGTRRPEAMTPDYRTMSLQERKDSNSDKIKKDLEYYLFKKNDWDKNINNLVNSIDFGHYLITYLSINETFDYDVKKNIMDNLEKYVVRENDIDLLNKLVKNGYRITITSFIECLKCGRKDILEWFIQNNLIQWENWYYNFDCDCIENFGDVTTDPNINNWATYKPRNYTILKYHILKKLITFKLLLKQHISEDESQYRSSGPDPHRLSEIGIHKSNIIKQCYEEYNSFIDFFIKKFDIKPIPDKFLIDFQKLERDIPSPEIQDYPLTFENPYIKNYLLTDRFYNIYDLLLYEPHSSYNRNYENCFTNVLDYAVYMKDISIIQILLNNGWKFTEYSSALAFIPVENNTEWDLHFDPELHIISSREQINCYKWCVDNGAPLPWDEKIFNRFSVLSNLDVLTYSIAKGYNFKDKLKEILKELDWDLLRCIKRQGPDPRILGSGNPVLGSGNPVLGSGNPVLGSGNPVLDNRRLSERSDGSGKKEVSIIYRYFNYKKVRELCKDVYKNKILLEKQEEDYYNDPPKIESFDEYDVDRFFEIQDKQEEFKNYKNIIKLYSEKIQEIEKYKKLLIIKTTLPKDIIDYCIVPFI